MARSGYLAKLYVGSGASTYKGAELTNVAVTINHEPIEVSDLADTWKARTAGPLSWEITGTKNYATAAMLAKMYASGAASMIVKVYKTTPSGTTANAMFAAWGIVTRAVTTFPMGAATEEITIVGAQKSMASGSQVRVNA